MINRIVLVLAGGVMLTSCSSNKTARPADGEWEFPLVETKKPAAPEPAADPAPPPVMKRPQDFRVPDVTKDLPDLGDQADPTPTPTPGITPTPGPVVTPAPGPTNSPPPELPPPPDPAPPLDDEPLEPPNE